MATKFSSAHKSNQKAVVLFLSMIAPRLEYAVLSKVRPSLFSGQSFLLSMGMYMVVLFSFVKYAI